MVICEGTSIPTGRCARRQRFNEALCFSCRTSRAILPRDDWRIRSGTIHVVVGEPIRVTGETRERLVHQVERFFRRELDLEPPRRVAEGK